VKTSKRKFLSPGRKKDFDDHRILENFDIVLYVAGNVQIRTKIVREWTYKVE